MSHATSKTLSDVLLGGFSFQDAFTSDVESDRPDAGISKQFESESDSLLELSARTIHEHRSLMAPLPNLFKPTFQIAHMRSVASERWLQQQIDVFDAGNRVRRKQVLTDFLSYVTATSCSSLAELFSSKADLFFVRLTSWFAVTLPTCYELALQLKVFLVFLAFREQHFVRACFESGLVVTLMNALSVDHDVPDDVRCLVLIVLQKLAGGRQHKEALCAQGLVGRILETVADGLQWDTLKSAGRLLLELFQSNPSYRAQVLDGLQSMLSRHPMAQRVGVQALACLLAEGQVPQPLRDPQRQRVLARLGLELLDHKDLQISSDAFCLLRNFIERLDCDSLFFDFTRKLVLSSNLDDWLSLEVAVASNSDSRFTSPGDEGSRRSYIAGRLDSRIANALSDTSQDGNATLGDDLRKEACFSLKWGLLLFLAKRNPKLLEELLDSGLTETLLMCVLDTTQPIRQAAALTELQRLQLMSKQARELTESVLVKRSMLSSLTLESFMAASPEDLARARFRLRNLWARTRQNRPGYGAAEHLLQQQLFEISTKEVLGPLALVDSKAPVAPVFLTEGQESQEQEDDAASGTEGDVCRLGAGRYPVRRVPADGASDRDLARGYTVDDAYLGELLSRQEPAYNLDTLFEDSEHKEESALMREVLELEALSRSVPRLKQFRYATGERKASHRPTAQFKRALALRAMPPKGMAGNEELVPQVAVKRPYSVLSMSQASDVSSTALSLRCGTLASSTANLNGIPAEPERLVCMNQCGSCKVCAIGALQRTPLYSPKVTKLPSLGRNHVTSLTETSYGVGDFLPSEISRESREEFSREKFSRDEFSREKFSVQTDGLAGGNSLLTAGTLDSESLDAASLLNMRGRSSMALDIEQAQLVERSTLATLVELPRKRILHINAAPYHNCVAFDGIDFAEERLERMRREEPLRQRLLEDLQAVGGFRRRRLVSHSRGAEKSEPPPGSGALTARERRTPPEAPPPAPSVKIGKSGISAGPFNGFVAGTGTGGSLHSLKDYFPAVGLV